MPDKLNIRQLRGWYYPSGSEDTVSTMEQDQRYSVHWVCETSCCGEWGPTHKEKDVVSRQWRVWLVRIATPLVIAGKILYSELCSRKLKWGQEVAEDIEKPWRTWKKWLAECPSFSFPRSAVNQELEKVDLHGFADASKLAVSVAIYAIAHRAVSPVNQNLLVC